MTSTTTMIQRLAGCKGTGDLTPWEESFVSSLIVQAETGQVTALSGKQVETLQRLFNKHFAG